MAKRRDLTKAQIDLLLDRADEAVDWLRHATTPYKGVSEESLENAYEAIETALSLASYINSKR